MSESSKSPGTQHEHTDVPDTIITLIVAFVIAMAFRGFVVEGFVIPTGSMAPTLLGEHNVWRGDETGYVYRTDAGVDFLVHPPYEIADPMLGRTADVTQYSGAALRARARPGDRVLVLKWLYMFFDPNRWDVIVFRNPTSVKESYIKRLIGLPNEELWLADGDVFTRPLDATDEPFHVQRKPEHVQRAVWQPVYNSMYAPEHDPSGNYRPPWIPDNERSWQWTDPRTLHLATEAASTVTWDSRRWPIKDTNAYNMAGPRTEYHTSDLRFATGIVPDSNTLTLRFDIRAKDHEFEFALEEGKAIVRYRPIRIDHETGEVLESVDDRAELTWIDASEANIDMVKAGRVVNLEFWHVDQAMSIFVNGERAVELNYDWDPYERWDYATGRSVERLLALDSRTQHWGRIVVPGVTEMSLAVSGSSATFHRMRVDRDLYYQPDMLGNDPRYPALGTHPLNTAKIGPDHFFMCGDNNSASKDSRLWSGKDNKVDPLVKEQIDDTPFLVHRDLIIGKAWCVYFPSPLPLHEGGRRFIPDFGRMRFIR